MAQNDDATTTIVRPSEDQYDALLPLQKYGLELKGLTRTRLVEQGWVLGDAAAAPPRDTESAAQSRPLRRRPRRIPCGLRIKEKC